MSDPIPRPFRGCMSTRSFAATRRTFMKSALAVAAASRIGHAAAAPSLSIPQVDSLTVQVLVDAATFGPFLSDQALPGLAVQRGSGKPAARMSRHALMAE